MKRLLPITTFFSATILIAALSLGVVPCNAQEIAPANYDEALVPEYVLPDPLVAEDGTKIETPEQWREKRRPLGGKATRKEIKIYFDAPNEFPQATVLLYIPNNRQGSVPVFVMPNFQGIHTTTDDPGVSAYKVENSTHNLEVRGKAKSRWAFDMIVSRGYAVATVFYEEIEPDVMCNFTRGVHPLFTNFDLNADDYPATIGAWAWGLSRVLDALGSVDGVDVEKAIVAGHSRLGKTALWCGANDERFAAVISNDSGCGGAALSRRQFGERVDRINASFPHWFTKKFHEYGNKVDQLPIDEHELIALIAPRPVYVASASEDLWADPKGEFLSALNADPVYKLLGTDGFGGVTEQPDVDTSVGATIRYHKRAGAHDVTDFDWEQYLNFADSIFKK